MVSSKVVDFGILPIVKRLTVTWIFDQFWSKTWQKKRKDMYYKLLSELFQIYLAVHEQSAAKNSFSTYVFNDPNGLFWLNLYFIDVWVVESWVTTSVLWIHVIDSICIMFSFASTCFDLKVYYYVRFLPRILVDC